MPNSHDTQDVTLAVINQKLIHVLERVDVAVEILERQDGRVRALETAMAILASEDHGKRIKALEDTTYPVVRFLKWAGAIGGGLLIALLWNLFIGSVSLTK